MTAGKPRRLGVHLGVFVVVLALVGVMAGCDSGGSSGDKRGGVLKIGFTQALDSINPFVATADSARALFGYIYPTLVQYDTSLKLVPNFADRWKVSPDGKTYTFRTHPGAKWSDGTPLTARDAAWTISTALKYGSGGAAAFGSYIAGAKKATALDANTLIVEVSEPQAAFLANLRQLPILPEHVWAQHAGGKDGANLKTYRNAPSSRAVVSGGPFVLTKYERQGVILTKRNPNYYGKTPLIDGFGLQYFSNPDAAVQALKNERIDALWKAPASAVRTLKADSGITVHTEPSLNSKEFIFNVNPKKTTNREILDPRLHEAFNYAIDRQQIIDKAYFGLARPGTSPIPVADKKWYNADVVPPPLDLDKANQILDGMGFKRGSNGVRVANGHPMSYKVVFPVDMQGAGTRTFQIIQADFAKIGVKLTLDSVDSATAAEMLTAPSDKFDLGMWGWGVPPDPNYILNTYRCSSYGSVSVTAFCDNKYDRLYTKQAAEMNEARRIQLVKELQAIHARALPEILYVYADWIDAWSHKWTGFGETPLGFYTPLTNMGLAGVHRS